MKQKEPEISERINTTLSLKHKQKLYKLMGLKTQKLGRRATIKEWMEEKIDEDYKKLNLK